MRHRIKNKRIIKPLFYILSGFFIILLLSISLYCLLGVSYKDKILPGILIGSIDISNKSKEEAKRMMNQRIDTFNQSGIIFQYDLRNIYIYPISSSIDGETTENLISFDVDGAIDKSFEIGRSNIFWKDFFDRIRLSIFQQKEYTNLAVQVDNERIIGIIEEDLLDYKYKNAAYYMDIDGEIGISPESKGKKFYYDPIILESNLSKFDFSKIDLTSLDELPQISEEDCLEKKEEVESLLTIAPITLKYNDGKWLIDKKQLLEWITIGKNEKNENIVQMDKIKIVTYLNEKVSPYIGIKPIKPKFSIENERVKDFEPGKEGFELDIGLASDALSKLPETRMNELTLETKIVAEVSDVKDVNGLSLGIKEIIGRNSLSFGNSSTSRIKNIKNGASKIDGILIKPGEEFSTIKTLGSIEEENGFVKEAVINGKAISQEVGGGLCHLSTTLFRTVLNAGLPVTMRQNHSYNMGYYSPSGTDATIYDPAPDFRFVNDTPNYILIRSWVVKSDLIIQFWGTKDGRTITTTKPVAYNLVQPQAAKMIKSKNLATGKVSCSYPAYTGADVYFDYKITYSDGTKKENRFLSHYVPRQGICYVGE
jgi:vancomycin resistance protein YoaR